MGHTKEQAHEYLRKWKAANKDKVKAYQQCFYKKHKDTEAARTKTWKQKNKDKHNASTAKAMAKAKATNKLMRWKRFLQGNAKRTKTGLPKYEITITEDDFHKISALPCWYCNEEVGNYRGLDRQDNNRGYHIDNIVASCSKCNVMKHMLSVSDFVSQVSKIYVNKCFV